MRVAARAIILQGNDSKCYRFNKEGAGNNSAPYNEEGNMIRSYIKQFMTVMLFGVVTLSSVSAKTAQERLDKQVVATVNDTDVTIKDLREFLRRETLSLRELINMDGGLEGVIKRKISEDILYEMAYSTDIKESEHFKEEALSYGEDLLINVYAQMRLSEKNGEKSYTKEELKAYLLQEITTLFNNINELEYYTDTRKKRNGEYVVAKYDGNYITLKEFGAFANIDNLTFEQFQSFDKRKVDYAIKKLIQKKLLKEKIMNYKVDIPNSKMFVTAFDEVKKKLLIEEYKKERMKQTKLTDEEINAHIKKYTEDNTHYGYYDIVLRNLYEAQSVAHELLDAIHKQESKGLAKEEWKREVIAIFKNKAKKYSIGKNAGSGGFIPFYAATRIDPTVRKQLEKMTPDSYGPFRYDASSDRYRYVPLKTKEGYHILYLEFVTKPDVDYRKLIEELREKKYKEALEMDVEDIYRRQKIETM